MTLIVGPVGSTPEQLVAAAREGQAIDDERAAIMEQARAVLADFDARHDTMLRATLAAVTAYLAAVRDAILGPARPDVDEFPPPQVWDNLITAHLDEEIRAAYTLAYLDVYDRAGMPTTVFAVEPFVTRYMETVHDRLRDWPAGVFEDIREEMTEALAANESVETMRDRIGRVLDIDAPAAAIRRQITSLTRTIDDPASTPAQRATARTKRTELHIHLRDEDKAWRWRAERIARTESAAAVNGGTYEAHVTRAAATGERVRKQWMATGDERVRGSHAAANGQVRDLSQPFDVGGSDLLFPGDPHGPAHEVINCRCALLIVHPGDEPLEMGPIGDADELTAALEAAVTAPAIDAPTAARSLPDGWRGPLAPLGVPSGDGRVITDPGDALAVRPLPLPLLAQEALAEGHDGAIVVGLIDNVWIEDGRLWGEGRLDLDDDASSRWARRLADGYAGWVSVDLDDSTMAERLYRQSDGQLVELELIADPDAEAMGLDGVFMEPEIPEGHQLVYAALKWRLMASTLVSQPAFHDGARVGPLWGYTGPGTGTPTPPTAIAAGADMKTVTTNGPLTPLRAAFPPPKAKGDAPAVAKPPATPDDDDDQKLPKVGDRVLVDDGDVSGPGEVTKVDTSTDPVMITVQLDAGGPVEVEADKVTPEGGEESEQEPDAKKKKAPPFPPGGKSSATISVRAALAASAGTITAPPRAWYSDPHLEEPTPLTVTSDGRVFGHLAVWDTCHVGITGQCVTPPRTASGYSMFHTGEVEVDDGALLPVGKITLGTGHADPEVGFRAAADHYDNSGAVVATVRAYEDAHGIAVAGALGPDLDHRLLAELRRSPLSGDWRRVGGALELIAALAVNVPGFPVRRPAIVASTGDAGRQMSLVAAGALSVRPDEGPALRGRLGDVIGKAVVRALDERDDRARRASVAAARIAGDDAPWGRTRAALAAARINGSAQLATSAAAAHGYKVGGAQ
jgi:hypothetical protein